MKIFAPALLPCFLFFFGCKSKAPYAASIKLDKFESIAFIDYVKQEGVSKSLDSYIVTERKENGKYEIEITPKGGWHADATGGCGDEGCDVTFFIDLKTLKILKRTIGT